MIILAALFISLFMRLGFWQIHRADEKMKMVSADEVQAKQEPIGWKTDQKMPFQYQRVMMQGHYLHPIFLLDNQHHQHQFGYDILSPFVFADGSVVVVDRGWVPGDSMRQAVPQIAVPRGLIQLQGSAYFPSNKAWGSN